MAGINDARRAVGTRGAKVEVAYDLTKGFTFLDGQYAVPNVFTVSATFEDKALTVVIAVEVVRRRARSREVCVSTDLPGGVTSTTLRAVPIRDIVAWGCRRVLHSAVPKADSTNGTDFTLGKVTRLQRPALDAIAALVGYVAMEEEDR